MEKIKFLPEPKYGFYNTLKGRVQEYFASHHISRYGNKGACLKAIMFLAAFLISYFAIIFGKLTLWLFYSAWFFMGMSIIFSAMSIIHDAAHNAVSPKRWVNLSLLYFANLFGGDGYMYKFKHNVSHHAYTNIPGIDIDLEQSSIVRVTPYTKSTAKHRLQHLYMKLIYPFYIFYWILLRDFKYYNRKKIGLATPHHKIIHWVVLVFSKIFYVFYIVVLPNMLLKNPFWQILLGFALMQLGSGLVAMFALLSNHVVEDSLFVIPDEKGLINCSWGEHQLRTTDDFSPDSRVISYFFSGLNHHVAHHLFPQYSHVHYPEITKIVRETAKEFGLSYRYRSITRGLYSHFKLLRKLSKAARPQ